MKRVLGEGQVEEKERTCFHLLSGFPDCVTLQGFFFFPIYRLCRDAIGSVVNICMERIGLLYFRKCWERIPGSAVTVFGLLCMRACTQRVLHTQTHTRVFIIFLLHLHIYKQSISWAKQTFLQETFPKGNLARPKIAFSPIRLRLASGRSVAFSSHLLTCSFSFVPLPFISFQHCQMWHLQTLDGNQKTISNHSWNSLQSS